MARLLRLDQHLLDVIATYRVDERPFGSEKNTNWEGRYRVPCLVRWPGVVKPGSEINDIMSHEDWLPTFMAAAGEPDIKEKLLKGYRAGERTYKVHLDGYDQRGLFAGKSPSKRNGFATGPTTASWRRSATINGNSSSWSRRRMA
jgi:arylsulfatase A-like enzyme